MTRSQESPATQSQGKGSHDLDSLVFGEVVEEDVFVDSDGSAVLDPSLPRPILVLVCRSDNCFFKGSLSSMEVSHETISFGSG